MRRGGGEAIHITQSNHTNRLPNAQPNARSNATIQPPDAVLSVNVLQSLAHSQILWAVRIFGLALHLDSNDLNRLIPRAQATTKTTCEDLLHTAKLRSILLACQLADASLGQPGKTES